jgi:enoyl-CoA hydratase/carnithine racemase
MDTFNFETLLVTSAADEIAVVSLNRVAVANAINTRMGLELTEVFQTLSTTAKPPRSIVLTAEGERHFCAGGDLEERNGMRDEDFLRQHAIFERMLLAIVDCRVPVIAAINGSAFAGGCELALACDFVYASENARFALTETSIGIMPGCGGTQHLPRAVGLRRAKELILTATSFSAREALEWGMVNRLCSPQSLREETLAAARRIATNAPLAIRQAKRAMDMGSRMDLRTAFFFEVDAYNQLVSTRDRREGISAFNERRTPSFTGS